MSTKIISDNHTEDKGYRAGHRYTRGGLEAYARGEMPMTYWTKNNLLRVTFKKLSTFSTNSDVTKQYKSALSYLGRTHEEVIKQLEKLPLDKLRAQLLEFKGTHYTGSYYRYTKFYGIVEDTVLIHRLKNTLIKRVEVTQLKLDI